MKNKQMIMAGLLFLLLCTENVFGQDMPFTLPEQQGVKKYTPPAIIKRGLCVYYLASGFVQDKPSPTTWAVYMVDYVDKEKVAGIVYRLNHSLMNVDMRPFMFLGNIGEFFFNYEYLEDAVLNPEKGVTITEHTFTYEHERGKVSAIIDDSGLITGFHSVSITANGRTSAVLEYKGHEYIQRPSMPLSFPAQALVAHQYTQSTGDQTNMMPIARLWIELSNKDVGVAAYKVTYQGFAGGVPAPASTSIQFGLTGWGPFYIHPDYLKTMQPGMVTIEFSKLQFKSVVTSVQMGQVQLDTYIGGSVVVRDIYDQASGLLKMHVKHIGGGTMLSTTLVQ